MTTNGARVAVRISGVWGSTASSDDCGSDVERKPLVREEDATVSDDGSVNKGNSVCGAGGNL